MKLALLFFMLAAPVAAQQADGGVPEDLQKELEKAIQADTQQKQGQKGPPVPAPAVAASAESAPQTLFRGAQSLNPDMSAILDADFGWQRRAPQLLSGDDPDLRAEGTRHAVGFTAQEVELPFSLTLNGEAFSLAADPADETQALPQPVPTFGADRSTRPTLAAEAKAFFPLGEEWSLYGGLNFASGKSPGLSLGDAGSAGFGREAQLYGADLYLKWKPVNVAQGYESLALQAEAILRHFASGDGLDGEWDGGGYAQVVAQFARRWCLGVRGDLVGVPSSSVLARTERVGLSLTFQGSEFSRLRAYFEAEYAGSPSSAFLPPAKPQWAPAAYLQLEYSIGAHGAHPY